MGDFWETIKSSTSDVFETISEGATDWLDNEVNTRLVERGARPETNEVKSSDFIHGDGKEKPTTTNVAPPKNQMISGVDNQTLMLGAVGLIAVVLVTKG